ncbi:MAG: hypothetical protein QOE29_2218, partial [Gaiellaceae bacterium]|nr:hypothetical protein [Gaiellaceae bacterium]
MLKREKLPERTRRSGAALGTAVGIAAALLLVAATSGSASRGTDDDPASTTADATHLPPVLTAADEPVRLSYDLNCASEEPEGCIGNGIAYVRRGNAGAFSSYPLRFDREAPSGRHSLDVPADIAHAREGFSYYAILTTSRGATLTVPAGGASAPDVSLPLDEADPAGIRAGARSGASAGAVPILTSARAIALGRHRFHATRAASERVASTTWGNGADEVGLEGGPQSEPIGGSSFDITPSGTIVLLDEAHKRLLEWSHGKHVASTPLEINGTIADLAVDADGSAYVLESTGEGSDRKPAIRHFDTRGRLTASWAASERSTAAIRIGAHGPTVLEYPSNHWVDVADGSTPLVAEAQRRSGHLGRPFPDGRRVLVLCTGQEVRVALVGHDGVRRSWRLLSKTPVAEVQLAEPLGQRLVVVFRTYTDSASEFEVAVLDRSGIAQQFSVPAADWAETAPVSRFRLAGKSLFHLGSTPDS